MIEVVQGEQEKKVVKKDKIEEGRMEGERIEKEEKKGRKEGEEL